MRKRAIYEYRCEGTPQPHIIIEYPNGVGRCTCALAGVEMVKDVPATEAGEAFVFRLKAIHQCKNCKTTNFTLWANNEGTHTRCHTCGMGGDILEEVPPQPAPLKPCPAGHQLYVLENEDGSIECHNETCGFKAPNREVWNRRAE